MNDMLIEEETRRIFPEAVQGEQSAMVQEDMKAWAVKKGVRPPDWGPTEDMIVMHAIDRGWLQANFTGMEIVD